MMAQLSVGIMGAGSIGCYVGGRLLASGSAAVTFVGRPRLAAELGEHGLTVRDHTGEQTVPPDLVRFRTEAGELSRCDAVIVAVKNADTPEAGRALAPVLIPGTVVASLQNGVHNAQALRESLPTCTVIAGVVDFNVVSLGAGVFHCGLDGGLSLERSNSSTTDSLARALGAAGFAVTEHDDIVPVQWTKLLINLNNAVSALSDVPTSELLASRAYRRINAALISEGVAVLRAAGIRPAPLRGLPAAVMPTILRLPDFLAHRVLAAQIRADTKARSSMWEDLSRGRPTEVDYLNGEIVSLAAGVGASASLNARMVELVHEAESAGQGPPGLTADGLWSQLHGG
jgi:2-dehydropantoate 2-reductase